MKPTLALLAVLVLSPFVHAQTKEPPKPDTIVLSEKDQADLLSIAEGLAELETNIKAARDQKAKAETELANAVAYINNYERVKAIQRAFLFKVAADNGHKSTEVMLAPDGKSIQLVKTVAKGK